MHMPRISRRVLVPGLLGLLAGCSGGGADAPMVVGDPEPGGTAIVAVEQDFQVFNPITNTALITSEVMNFMLFTPLIQFDENFEAVPALAESWDLEETGVTFHLRDDVTWHDGQPVTADDVLFTFETAKNPEAASLLESAFLTMVESAEVIDPQTIRFDFVAPHSQPMQAFWWPPIPRHILGDTPVGQLSQAPYNRDPVGNGPFRFASWESGTQVVVEANDEYPEELGGRPLLDRVVFRVVPEATTRLTEILTGATDLNYSVLPDEAQQVEGQTGVQLIHYPGRQFVYMGLNNEREPFSDPLVRRAVATGIDRQALIDALLFGYAEIATGMIPPWSPVAPDIEPLPYDPEGARALLQEAGYTPGPDGIMQRDGQPLRFTLLTSEDRLRQDLTVVLQQQLRQIGATVDVRAIEFQTMLQQHRARDYDAVLSSWILDTFRVDPNPLFSCEEAQTPESANRAGYCNPQADSLAAAGLRTIDDDEARQTWTLFSEILQEDQPIVILFWQEQLSAISQRLQGVEMDVRGKLITAQEWWIPAGQR
ncbi:MAG: ABC transporter substrate-binding protein [Gemmatimonadota bacterium]